ncbi:hypothetical protein [Nocardia xishanensis]
MAPVFELLIRGAPRADIDHHRYDLAQLTLRLIDYVVQNQATLTGVVSLESLTDHLTQLARRMYPADPDRPYRKVAQLVFGSVFNDGRPHEATWLDLDVTPAGEHPEASPFRFRLLRMVDSDEGAAVTATREAILLYLQALNTDLADQALALKLMVEIQMQAGEFDKALDTARQATRTAHGLAAYLRERLADTRRDVTSVDWGGEMGQWLTAALGQVQDQITRDRQLLDLTVTASEDPLAQAACRAIAEEVSTGDDVWTALANQLQMANAEFLKAQGTQRFRPRGLAAAINMHRDVFEPAVLAEPAVFDHATEILTTGIAAPPKPVLWGLGDLTDLLFKAPMSYERRPPDVDDPGDLDDPPADFLATDIAHCAASVLNIAADKPTRLSQLLTAARERAGEVSDPILLLDVLWASALWLYVSDDGHTSTEVKPANIDLATALAALTAVSDATTLTDDRYRGPDLTLGRPAALESADLDTLGVP